MKNSLTDAVNLRNVNRSLFAAAMVQLTMLSEVSCGRLSNTAVIVLSSSEHTMLFLTREASSASRNKICNMCIRVSSAKLLTCVSMQNFN